MNSTVQFYLSQIAAHVVDIDRLKFRARDRGIPEARVETSEYRTGGRVRVTCKAPIAELLLEELRTTIAKATTRAVVDACEHAIAAIEEAKAIDASPTRARTSDAARGILGT